jgi:hypothetical protein
MAAVGLQAAIQVVLPQGPLMAQSRTPTPQGLSAAVKPYARAGQFVAKHRQVQFALVFVWKPTRSLHSLHKAEPRQQALAEPK